MIFPVIFCIHKRWVIWVLDVMVAVVSVAQLYATKVIVIAMMFDHCLVCSQGQSTRNA